MSSLSMKGNEASVVAPGDLESLDAADQEGHSTVFNTIVNIICTTVRLGLNLRSLSDFA